VIIDLQRFIETERPYWTELETVLDRLDDRVSDRLNVEQARRLHYLYERAAADLGRLTTFASEPELRLFLERIVGRAYAHVHEQGRRIEKVRPMAWLFGTFPRTFRRHVRAFWLSVALTLVGVVFGGVVVAVDPEAKAIIMPFPHLLMHPSERVAKEEQMAGGNMDGQMAGFSTELMTHNTKVSITVMALGLTWGIGAALLLFSNGVMLGAVIVDYLMAGEGVFLAGWLLPHGTIEIPAILIAGQAGLLLAGALIGWGDRRGIRTRLRVLAPDLATLIGGVALMLVWAGIVESFLSQLHAPVLPYWAKIVFGLVELGLLIAFLGRSGRGAADSADSAGVETEAKR
jgi:uncharacterized membrane protein SpoIIM required for sporulation